jgi:hypothetical protein
VALQGKLPKDELLYQSISEKEVSFCYHVCRALRLGACLFVDCILGFHPVTSAANISAVMKAFSEHPTTQLISLPLYLHFGPRVQAFPSQ